MVSRGCGLIFLILGAERKGRSYGGQYKGNINSLPPFYIVVFDL